VLGVALPPLPPAAFETARPVHATIALRTAPGGRVFVRLGRRTEFGSPLVLGVGARRGRWVGLISPALPNGRLGWTRAQALRFAAAPYAIRVDLPARRLVLLRDGLVIRRVTVGIGGARTPTPPGRYTITDKLAGGGVYGCCILALSGHQPRPPAGWRGEARLGIHGGAPGAVSAGCLHVPEPDLRYLMAHVPLGTPVTVRS
jgi:lipoprotein-anchoring transpeptidase ErfK/SrfK